MFAVFGFRLVKEGHVPYVNSYEELPEEMKLDGKDALIFRVEVRIHQLLILNQSIDQYCDRSFM